MEGRRVVIIGAGQTDFELEDQPIGNGRALALLLAREGAHVMAVDRDEASVNDTVQLIRSEGVRPTSCWPMSRNLRPSGK